MNKVRYGVIGIKGVGRLHIDSVKQNPSVELTALVDVNETLVKTRSQQLKVRAFTDHRDLLNAGLVDAVSIATPHRFLAPIALDCLNAGVHVFIEKPLAIRISEANAVCRMAKAKNLKICVGYLHRTYKLSLAMKHLLDSGSVGNIMRVLWTWQEFRPEIYYTPDPWRGTFRDAGGGVLMSQVSHQLDLICWMLGKPAQVSAMMGNQLHKSEIEDVVSANLFFDNGAFGTLQFNINQTSAYSLRQIAGDKGILIVPNFKSLGTDENDEILLGTYSGNLQAIINQLKGDGDQPEISWQTIQAFNYGSHKSDLSVKISKALKRIGLVRKEALPSAHSIVLDSFIDAILHGGDPLVSGDSARSSVELINALILSAMRKKVVDLPIDPDEYDCLIQELSDGRTKMPVLRPL